MTGAGGVGKSAKDRSLLCVRIPGPEIQRLCDLAKTVDAYIAGMVWEIMDDWPDRYWNTAFICSPEGEVVLKYHKHYDPLGKTKPGDVLEEYVGRYGEDALFPVVDTPIGRLGCLTCYDINFPEMARCLVQTPGFYLTSFPGIGIVLAGGIMAEYGDRRHWPPVDNMASYAGIVPREKQTGGIDKAPLKGHLPMDCNRMLKDWLLQGAYHVGTTKHPMQKIDGNDGSHRLLEHYCRIENNEGKSRLSTAKLLLKISRRMVMNERVYLPSKWVLKPASSEEELFLYLDVVNSTLSH